MATIQIREIPEDAYQVIRRRARVAGQSIQGYMRDQVLDLASRRTKEEAWAAVDSVLDGEGSSRPTLEQIVRDLAENRR